MSTAKPLDRRTLLRGAAGTVGATALGGPVLAGCSKKSSASNSSASNAHVQLPKYIPYTAVKTDLPAKNLVEAGSLTFPKDLIQFSTDKPLNGGQVTVITNAVALPPSLGKNKYWQEFNKQAGGNVKYTAVPVDYQDKLEVVVAGNELPDLVYLTPIANLPGLLASKFADLSPWLSGNKIKNYPGLANIPATTWKSTIYDGGIYTIPFNRPPYTNEMEIRLDLIESAGADPNVGSYADFLSLCRAVNSPKHGRWSMGSPPSTLLFIREMLGNANPWSIDSGKFTYYGEQDSYKQALDSVTKMWKEGLFHPDSFTKSNNLADWVGGGVVVMNNGIGAAGYYTAYADTGISPGLRMGQIVPPKYDGGGDGHKYLGPASHDSGVAIRKAGKGRIEELLRFFNWLASPFGTKEWMFFRYGIEGRDFAYKKGVPVKTQAGLAETALPVTYTGAGPEVNISPGHADYVKRYYAFQERCAKIAMPLTTLGLYSPTDQAHGATLATNISNVTNDIITGRKPLSAWDELMKTWKSSGGETIRTEYQKAYAKRH